MDMDGPVVKMENVCFSYNGNPVLEDVNLVIGKGDLLAVIGPNGGGKTTLLKLIMGFLKPDSGRISVMGRQPSRVAAQIGYVPQNVHINNSFPITVMDVVLMGRLGIDGKLRRFSGKSRKKAYQALEQMDIAGYAESKIGHLSAGQRQRVLIARALVTEPALMLLDEPTASIDTGGQVEFYKLLNRMDRDMTVVVVSHDLLVISNYVQSVACVNRTLHYHDDSVVTGNMLDTMYSCSADGICPVDFMGRHLSEGVPGHSKDGK
ncbi:MAG: ABC transporter ATP-binding protein [Desulfobacteraceae bacterium]